MNRREFLKVGTAAACTAQVSGKQPVRGQSPGRNPQGAEPPNILLLFTDEQRFDAMGCAGNEVLRTPRLDSLAESGVRFSQACTPSPVCVAARMSMITGHRASRTHWVGNGILPGPVPELPTLMTLLATAGYRTHAIGKMHFRGRHYGLHRHESMEEGGRYRIDSDYLNYLQDHGVRTRYPQGLRDLLYFQPQTSGIPPERSQSTWVADRSIEFLRSHVAHRKPQPFFLWSSWIAPHPPFAPCEPYDSMYDPKNMPLPNQTDRPISSMPYPTWRHRARLDGAHLDPDRMRRIRALYYGQVSHVDDAIGRVLGELNRLGLANNTVVLFTSDHGEMLGDLGLSQKFVPYEASVRIPFLLRWPGKTTPGRVCEDLVGLTDIFPTLIEEIGLEYPSALGPLTGRSLLSDRGGGLLPERDAYFTEYGQGEERWVSIRTRTHKYSLWAAGGCEELYDLARDPGERENLAGVKSRLAAEFRARVLKWEREFGLDGSFDGSEFRTYPERTPPTEDPRNVVINEGPWPENLPQNERDSVETYAEAFSRAISKETSLSPDKLSLGIYKRKGGASLVGTPWEEAWRKA